MQNITKREQTLLERKQLHNKSHLRRWFPIRYIDNTKETGLIDGEHCCIIGKITSLSEKAMKQKKGQRYLRITVQERLSKANVTIFIFGYKNMFKQYYFFCDTKAQVFISGKGKHDPTYGWSMENIEIFDEVSPDVFQLTPVYSMIGTMNKNKVEGLIKDAFLEKETDTVPGWMKRQYHLCDINDALRGVMLPKTQQDVSEGLKRLLFDDLFYLAAQFTLGTRKKRAQNEPYISKTEIMEEVISKFPYPLTGGQKDTVNQIIEIIKRGDPLHALVQGDVGCGKTITGFLPIVAAAENGVQTCLLAPTKNLAKQHYHKLKELLEESDIRIGLFCGDSVTKSELKKLREGETLIAIGTHSLLSDRIEFQNLRLVVIDEEHKFGVAQRNKLSEKAAMVDVISMTATPIPRTLAQALYGEDVSVFSIKEKPGGRKDVLTYMDHGPARESYGNYILNQGQQVYVVCPSIEESIPGIMSVAEAFQLYQGLFPGKNIATLDGNMKATESERVLEEFRTGKIDILIATTVVEVGIDVPNATVIFIENAERFGLSQLHQLRGRVGRGKEQSYCILISSNAENQRLQTLCQISDGFEISRIDLEQLRHSGNLFGEEQSGYNACIEEMLNFHDAYQAILEDTKSLSDEILTNHINKIAATEVPGKHRTIHIVQQAP